LSCQEAAAEIPTELKATKKWPNEDWDIRVILGPQEDHFAPDSLNQFFSQPWTISRQTDRMGMRLEGTPLAHNELGADIVSDGVTPGAIQVPANGRPIILLADCQTSGGYPKIATIISADLSKLAHRKPGDILRFIKVNQQEAKEALNRKTQLFETWKQSIQPFLPPGSIDFTALYNSNLVSGVLSGSEE
jgi:allophanate hydrolase subunit 2